MEAPVIIIYSLEHARAALAAARSRRASVILRSAPDLAFSAGPAYFTRLAERARAEFPDVRCRFVLDCGDDPGVALGALRSGVRELAFAGRPEVAAKLGDIARRRGARVQWERGRASGGPSTRTLDLLDARDPFKACLDWLAERSAAGRVRRAD